MEMFLRQAAGCFLKRIRFPSQTVVASCKRTTNALLLPLSSKMTVSCQYEYGFGGYTWRRHHRDLCLWIIVSGQAAIILGINANPALAEDVSIESHSENDTEGANINGLRRIEDGSVISNIHTSKWRIFTDKGRDLFVQGKWKEAENYFLSALQEAKEGFGERDPHVASACNNLAELYRVKKAFDKAEPLYLDAIHILEESFGPEDIRVGVAFHNLGQFYLVQRKLEEARICYERALKIKGRVLGHGHIDYADTMYHLGTVLYLQGKENDAEALIKDSIRILEESSQGESITCIRRLRYLAQIYLKSNRLVEAENVQRKILQALELSKGWNSLHTVIAAEGLALTLLSVGSLKEAEEFLQRCLDTRKTLLPKDHIQIGANMLHLARVAMLKSNRLRKMDISKAIAELDKAKDLLSNSIRIAQQVLYGLIKQKNNLQNYGASGQSRNDGRAALAILLQSLDALGLLEITEQELQESMEEHRPVVEAENALRQCISAYKKFGTEKSIFDSPQVKAEYLSCLKHLSSLISDGINSGTQQSRGTSLQELKDEIERVEAEIFPYRKHKN